MSTVYRASSDDPVLPRTEQRLGNARLVDDEIVVTHRRRVDRIPLTAIDRLEVTGKRVRIFLVKDMDRTLTAPNKTAAHIFASAVAAALTPAKVRKSTGAVRSERRASVWTRKRRRIVTTLSVVAYLIAGLVLLIAGANAAGERNAAVFLGLLMSPIGTAVTVAMWFRHWKLVLARRRRGVTVTGEKTGSSYRGRLLVDGYTFTTADGRTITRSEPGVRSTDGRVEVVYDPEDPTNHAVKVDAWGTAIPYLISIVFPLMAVSLPAALVYAFVV
ncbi:hypothetical protein WEI85_29685 [Actinomycetes bacterium KLBMP 9797]